MLSSLLTATEQPNMAVAIFQDDELYLTPLQGIVQMRPQFSYLDKNDKRSREETKTPGEDGDEEEDVALVQVKFARHQPENIKKIQEQSFKHHKKSSQEEQWIRANYVSHYDTQAELMRMEMFCPSTEESSGSLNLLAHQYLERNHSVQPKSAKEQCPKPSQENTKFSNIAIFPLFDQIKLIMNRVKITSFANLCGILSSERDTDAILKYLQQVAVLVQGNWVVISELIYPEKIFSSQTGIPNELMCRTRDYILLLFTEQQYLDRKAILSSVKLPPVEVTEILKNLCCYEPRKGWQLTVPPNWDFCDRYPEIAQRQETFWESKRKQLREAMEAQNQPPQRQRRKSNRESLGSENEERNVGRGRKSLRDSSLSDNDGVNEPNKPKKTSRSRKVSETTTT